jgi:hypothetical protein
MEKRKLLPCLLKTFARAWDGSKIPWSRDMDGALLKRPKEMIFTEYSRKIIKNLTRLVQASATKTSLYPTFNFFQ